MSEVIEPILKNYHCQHFVQRKKRYCRMTVKKGNKYCGEHEPTTTPNNEPDIPDTNNRLRVTCPLDPTHSCFASKLNKHLKVCNAKEISHPAYIEKGINLGYDSMSQTDENRLELSVIDTEEVLNIVNKINKLYNDLFKKDIEQSNYRHVLLNDECNGESYGTNKRRHLIQTSALMGLLQENNFLMSNTCFVEFGGGKGHMTYWLARISESISDTSIVLVDRASHRHKQDNKLDSTRHRVHRIRADISDLLLEKLDYVSQSENVIGVGKHLCGAATDLAFRCMARHDKCKTSGVVLAFCCHHRCTWLTYTGRTWLESLGFCKKDFDIMCAISSWATCGSGLSRERRHGAEVDSEEHSDNQINNEDKTINPTNSESDTNQEMHYTTNADIKRNRFGLTQSERESIGRRTKHVIDYGRTRFLQDNGYPHSQLLYYVPEEMTPENLCIVAKRDANANNDDNEISNKTDVA